MSQELRERAVLPLFMPVAILLFMGALVWGFSRILLNVPQEVAVAVALMAALNILGACTVAAIFPRLRGVHLLPLLAVVAVPMAIGAGIAVGLIPAEKAEEHGGGQAEPVAISAANLAFDKSELSVAGGGDVTIEFDNREAIPHNVAVYTGPDAAQPVFQGEIFPGPAKKTYTFKAPAPGKYFFRCDVHPAQMTGTLVVAEGGAKEPGGGLKVSAKGLAFDTKEIALSSGGPATIEFDNQEAQPHNIAVYEGTSAGGKSVFKGEIFTGPAKRKYSFAAPPPGRYYFQCDVHPTMNGTVVVR